MPGELNTHDISTLLRAMSEGDQSALDGLTPIVYDELRRLAHHYMERERPGHMLQTTALVNEAYLRLTDYRRMRWENRAHFFAVSAQLMRRILVDHARSRIAVRFSGKKRDVELLAGQALFKVAHDKARAFKVIVGNGTVTDGDALR